MKRFNKWVDPQNYFSLSNGTLEILSFLAYGIVANLTDMALIIREVRGLYIKKYNCELYF